MAWQAATNAINMAVAINNATGIARSLVESGQIEASEVNDTIEAYKDNFFVELTEAAAMDDTAAASAPAAKSKGKGKAASFAPKPKATSADPASEPFTFGKYKGETVQAVADKDMPYLEWIRDNNKWNIVTEYFEKVQAGV